MLCLTIAAYARFLSTGFAASDSLPLVASSRLTSPQDAVRLFTSPVLAGTSFTLNEVVYRPFVSLTFGLDYLIWGQVAFGYHLTNLALHVATVAAVWLLLRSLGLGGLASVLGAGVFAFHPLVVAAVPVIARRDSILPVTAFTLAAALLLIAVGTSGRRRRALNGGSLLLTAVALLSKETAFLAVALLPVLIAARHFSEGGGSRLPVNGAVGTQSRNVGAPGAITRALLLALPHIGLAMLLFALRLVVLGGLGGIGDSDVTEVDAYQYGTLLASYGREFFWAFAALRPFTRELWLQLGAIVLVGVVLLVAWLPRRQSTLVALGAAWLVAFGVFSAIFKVTTIGWLAYFALVGAALVIAAAVEGAFQRMRRARWDLLPAGATLACLAAFLGISLSDSVLVRDYPQWQLAGEVSDRYLQALRSCTTSIPYVWDEEYVSLQRVPAAYQDGRPETDMLGVTIIEQYTAETALRQSFPDRQMLVHVGSVSTLHSSEMQFNCAPLPHGLEFTAVY